MSAATQAPTRRGSGDRRARRSGARVVRPPRVGAEQHDQQRPQRPARALGSLPFVVLVSALLSAGLLALLLINNALAAGSFEQARLRADATLLAEQEQALNQQVERLSAPTRLRQAAHDLGLVPAGSTVYVDLTDGRILGIPQPAGGAGGSSTAPATSLDAGTPADGTAPTTGTDAATGGDTADPGQSGDSAMVTGPDSPQHAATGGDGAELPPSGTAYDRAVVSGGPR